MKQITKLDESALRALGFDLPTVKALSNISRVAGNETDSPTVPDVAEQTDSNSILIGAIQGQLGILGAILDFLQTAPGPIQIDLSHIDDASLTPAPLHQIQKDIEFIQTEVRQNAEKIAQQVEFIQTEVRQNSERLAQIAEHLTTEVRQLADHQVVNSNQIQELKQGTML